MVKAVIGFFTGIGAVCRCALATRILAAQSNHLTDREAGYCAAIYNVVGAWFNSSTDDVSIQTAALAAPLLLETLNLSPAWLLLFSGSPGIDMQVSWQGQQAEALLFWQDGNIDVQDFLADVDMAVLQLLWKKYLPVTANATGRVQVRGDFRLDAANGWPLTGMLEAGWHAAGVDFNGKIPLGDYQLAVKSEHDADPWSWVLSGGTALLIEGEGAIVAPLNPQLPWSMHGQASIAAAKEAVQLSAMLGNIPLKYRLSGPIFKPRVQRM